MSFAQISKLIGTTKNTIDSVKNKTHWNFHNLRPKDPVLLGLCTQTDLNLVHEAAQKRKEREQKTKKIDIDDPNVMSKIDVESVISSMGEKEA